MPENDFIRLWNRSVSTFAVAKVVGTTPILATARACRLRRKGMDLRRMKKHQDPQRAEIRSRAARLRKDKLRAKLACDIPAGFFQDHADTSWVWMAGQTGLDVRTLKRIAQDRGFDGKVAGNKKVAHFECPHNVRDYIDGLILSDGGLAKANRRSYVQESVSEDWLQQIQSDFSTWGIESVIDPASRPGRKPSFRIRTPVYQEFGVFGSRWYPAGVKVIPRDLDVRSAALLRNMYLGDGTMAGHVLEVCLEGFLDDDVEWLRDELNRVHGLNAGLRKVQAGLRIKIFARWRNQFYDLIEYNVPVSLQHRFRRSTGRFKK